MGVARHIEVLEVEFPNVAVVCAEIGEVTMGIGEGEADLDEVEEIDVGLEDGVVGGRVTTEGGGTDDDARKFCVHGDEGELVDEETDQVEFRFDVG